MFTLYFDIFLNRRRRLEFDDFYQKNSKNEQKSRESEKLLRFDDFLPIILSKKIAKMKFRKDVNKLSRFIC